MFLQRKTTKFEPSYIIVGKKNLKQLCGRWFISSSNNQTILLLGKYPRELKKIICIQKLTNECSEQPYSSHPKSGNNPNVIQLSWLMALLKILMLFCLLDLPISDKDMLMSPTIIVDLSISPHVLSIFISHILLLHCQAHTCWGLLCFLGELTPLSLYNALYYFW